MLGADEIARFRELGFIVFRGLLRADEIAVLEAELVRGLEAAYQAAPFDGTRRHSAALMTEETPAFRALLEDPRLCGVAEQLYGDDVIGIAADGSRHVGDTIWHPDTVDFELYGMKFLIYLAPLTKETGALQLVPGSHRRALHDTIRRSVQRRDDDVGDVPVHVFECQPGDVIGYDLRLWHASAGGAPDRRAGSVYYYNNPKTEAELRATREQDLLVRMHIRELCRAGARFGSAENPLFDAGWIADPEASPRRKRWIARLRELGFFDAVELPAYDRDRMPHR